MIAESQSYLYYDFEDLLPDHSQPTFIDAGMKTDVFSAHNFSDQPIP